MSRGASLKARGQCSGLTGHSVLIAVEDDLAAVRRCVLKFLLQDFQRLPSVKAELRTFAELTALEIVSIALCSGVPAASDVHIFGPTLSR